MGKLRVQHGAYPAHTVEGGTKAYRWCFSNKILIGPVPLWGDDYNKWTVEITMNGKKHTDPNKYESDSILHKVYEYCDYYYNKYKKEGE